MQYLVCCQFLQTLQHLLLSCHLSKYELSAAFVLFKICNFVPNILLQDLDISQGSVLYDVDEATVRSLNGCRVADQILRLVPNVEVDSRDHLLSYFVLCCLFSQNIRIATYLYAHFLAELPYGIKVFEVLGKKKRCLL